MSTYSKMNFVVVEYFQPLIIDFLKMFHDADGDDSFDQHPNLQKMNAFVFQQICFLIKGRKHFGKRHAVKQQKTMQEVRERVGLIDR